MTAQPKLGELAVAPLPPVKDRAARMLLHCAILLDDGRVLGDQTFRLASLQGQEAISDHFEFDLELHGDSDPGGVDPIAFDRVIGRSATFGIALSEQGIEPDRFRAALLTTEASFAPYADELAVRNGIVASFAMDAPGVYRMTLRPALWKLTLTNRYTIHRSKTVRQAIADLLQEHRIAHSFEGVDHEHNLAQARTQDWLQSGETDYDFVRRLMGKAHLYYYYRFAGGMHKVVFSNRPSYPRAWPVQAGKPPREVDRPLSYTYLGEDALGMEQRDVVTEYAYRQSLVSSGVRTVFANQGAAWHQDALAGFSTFHAPASAQSGPLPFHLYKVYQYGVSNDEVEHFTAQTARTLGASGVQLSGASHCPRFRVGHQFVLSGTVRPEIDGRAFVLTQVQHQASLDGTYKNQFQATDAHCLVAPFSVQETQQQSILARVVPAPAGGAEASGKRPASWKWYQKDNFAGGGSTFVDALASPKNFGATGVYVQLATEAGQPQPRTTWVKLAPHVTAVPEIGTMVLVSRAQDESELPEIQNVQANGSLTVTPEKWTANTHVGSSYSTSYADSMSIRYAYNPSAGQSGDTLDFAGATKKVEEKYNEKKYREAGYSQGGSYSYSSAERGRAGLLSESESYGSTYSKHYAAETDSYSDIDKVTSTSFAGTTDSKSTVKGKSTSTSTYEGTVESTNTHKDDVTSTSTYDKKLTSNTTHTGQVKSDTTYGALVDSTTTHNGEVKSKTDHNDNVTSNSYYKKTLTSTTTHDGKVSSTTTHNGDVSSTTTHAGNVSSTNTGRGQTSSSAWIATNSNDAVGFHNSNSATGVSASVRVVGASRDLSASVSANSITATGWTTHTSLIGGTTSVDIVGTGVRIFNKAAVAELDLAGSKVTLMSTIRLFI